MLGNQWLGTAVDRDKNSARPAATSHIAQLLQFAGEGLCITGSPSAAPEALTRGCVVQRESIRGFQCCACASQALAEILHLFLVQHFPAVALSRRILSMSCGMPWLFIRRFATDAWCRACLIRASAVAPAPQRSRTRLAVHSAPISSVSRRCRPCTTVWTFGPRHNWTVHVQAPIAPSG